MNVSLRRKLALLAAGAALALSAFPGTADAQDCQGKMRKIQIGVAVTPPNVLHTPPFVADKLGYFAKRCIEATMLNFEGGQSASAKAAVAQGLGIATISEIAIAQGLEAHQFYSYAPKLPHLYVVTGDIKTPADLKDKRLSASGGGVGGMNWRLARTVLAEADLTVDDVKFIPQGTAGRLPGLLTGQLDGVSLHPEDLYIGQQQKPDLHVLAKMSDLLPNYTSGAYGASDAFIAENRDLVVDVVASMMEAIRTMYQEPDKVVPIIADATAKPAEAVAHSLGVLTESCTWAVNAGFDKARTEWMIENSIANGDIEEANRPTYEEVVDESISRDALAKIGGPVAIGNCSM